MIFFSSMKGVYMMQAWMHMSAHFTTSYTTNAEGVISRKTKVLREGYSLICDDAEV